jgi:holo-[acyl-carrier protein] synthase
VRVGIDLIEIARIERALRRWGERFVTRVYTPAEATTARGRAEALAGRFAAKEAAAKALGVGIGPVDWRDIEVAVGAAGEPLLLLHGRARALSERLGLSEAAVSISDTAAHSVASVVMH